MSAVRVTVCGEGRWVDLSLPDALPVAELVAEVAGLLGAPSPGTGPPRLRTLTGAELDDDRSLAAQGVGDGVILQFDTAPVPAPVVHDDLAEAVVETLADLIEPGGVPAPGPRARACAMVVAGLLAIAVSLLPEGLVHVPGSRRVAVVLVALAVAVVVAGALAPDLALAVAGVAAPWPGEPPGPADVARLTPDVGRAHRVLVVTTAVVAALPGAVALPASSLGPPAALLVCACAVLVVLRVRRFASPAVRRAGRLPGLGSLALAAACSLSTHGRLLLPAGLVAVAAGATYALPPRTRTRVADLAETLCVVAIPPLLLLTSGLVDEVAG